MIHRNKFTALKAISTTNSDEHIVVVYCVVPNI